MASLCEHYHYTPNQIGEMTLYQIRIAALGAEKVAEISREHASRKQDEAIRKKRQERIAFYERHGYNAR